MNIRHPVALGAPPSPEFDDLESRHAPARSAVRFAHIFNHLQELARRGFDA